jgi:acid phosphatase (class A)
MKNIIILSFIYCSFSSYGQQFKLESASAHYKTLQQFNGSENRQRAWMDTIRYPSAEYSSSILYLLIKPYYLSESQVKTLTESVGFPKNSSDQVRKELEYMLDLQDKRTPGLITRVEFLAHIGYWPSINLMPTHPSYEQNLKDLFFEGREVFGENISAQNFPKIAKVLQGVMQDMRLMEFSIKYKHLRPRPYHLEPKLEPLARIHSPSFVSGHTLWAYIQAFVWSEIIPEKQQEFMALAEEIRRSREIMGIHFPSDNESARQVAYQMLTYYFKNKTFQNDFRESVHEWKSSRHKYIK